MPTDISSAGSVIPVAPTPTPLEQANVPAAAIDPFSPIQPGETNTQYMARITQAYKDVPQPTLTPAQSAAGATVQFVRTGAAGVGEYKIVYPMGQSFDPATGQPVGSNAFANPSINPAFPWKSGAGTAQDPFRDASGNPFNGTDANGMKIVNGVLGSPSDPNNPVVPPNSAVSQTARDVINGFLSGAGMEALGPDVWKQWTAGTTAAQIMDYIRNTPQYAARFPAMAALNKSGRNISEAAYIAKETSDIELMKRYGVPAGIFDNKQYLGSLIENNVDLTTLQLRLIAAQDTVMSYDASIKDYAKTAYGLDDGHLMAWALDSTLALPVIEQQAKAIKIGGAAFAAGLKLEDVSKAGAESLAAAGVTQEQAKQGFTNIAQMGQYRTKLPGSNPMETLTTQELIDAQFATSPEAIVKLNKAKQTKLSEYAQGGQFAATQGGVSGIGSGPST